MTMTAPCRQTISLSLVNGGSYIPFELDGQNDLPVDAGTYSITEPAYGGIDTTYDNCANIVIPNGGSATCTITNNDQDILPTIDLTKSAVPGLLTEPGGDFVFTIFIENKSVEPVTITTLTDTRFVDLPISCQALVGTTLAVGGIKTCSYTVAYTNAGSYENTAYVLVTDNEGSTGDDSDSETVTVTDVLPDITVTKKADPTSVPETGAGGVYYTFRVTNIGPEAVTISSLSDSVFTFINGDADCKVGTVLAKDAYCEFSERLYPSGDFPGSHVNVFTATASDDDGNTDLCLR